MWWPLAVLPLVALPSVPAGYFFLQIGLWAAVVGDGPGEGVESAVGSAIVTPWLVVRCLMVLAGVCAVVACLVRRTGWMWVLIVTTWLLPWVGAVVTIFIAHGAACAVDTYSGPSCG